MGLVWLVCVSFGALWGLGRRGGRGERGVRGSVGGGVEAEGLFEFEGVAVAPEDVRSLYKICYLLYVFQLEVISHLFG